MSNRLELVSPEAAIDLLHPAWHLAFSSYACEPQALVDAWVARTDLHPNARVYQALTGTRGRILEPAAAGYQLVTYNPESRGTQAIGEGRADFLPASIYRACRWLLDGQLRIDAAVIHTTPPDDNGYCSFGLSNDFSAVAASVARVVIAQFNDVMPRTFGDCTIHISKISAATEVSQVIPEVVPTATDATSMRVGQFVAELVPDGATIELGVGSVAVAVAESLKGHKGLGVHSGLLSDALLSLLESGAATNEMKASYPGKTITNQITGSRRLYDFVNGNPGVEMRTATEVHDPRVLSEIRDFIAIHGAIQVDLRGQVNSEFLNGKQVSGPGGAPDFALGATYAPGGKSIVALKSTTDNARYSRIVASLEGTPVVSLSETMVDYVVTEFGIAELRGRTLRERAKALIAIAHPDFRAELEHHLN